MPTELIAALRRVCMEGVQNATEGGEILSRVVAAVDWDGPLVTPTPCSFPVVARHMAAMRGPAEGTPGAALAAALRASAAALTWHEAYTNYAGEPDMDAMRPNYAYADLVGPDGFISSDEVYIGVSIQAPKTFYPPHVHKSVEVYYVVAGTAEWQRGAEAWVRRAPGTYLLHGSGVCHAMRTADEPLLALTVWLGDVNSESVVVRA